MLKQTTKFIFITGGVVSGIGKGITCASTGVILKSNGFKVDVIKFDPYLNVDPGTMSPYEHGEVYVLDDGSETDLDLGHYERFLDINLTGISSVTAGKIFSKILDQERKGFYLGKNVQLTPNVTDFVKESFTRQTKGVDIRLIEIGGSTGDMEAQIFLESFRQFRRQNKHDILHIHLGYVPFLGCTGEYKSKPIQTSLRELLRSGLQPDLIVARYEKQKNQDINSETIDKIALFSNLSKENVIIQPDLETIYQVPAHLASSNLKLALKNLWNIDIKSNKLPTFFQNSSFLTSKILKNTSDQKNNKQLNPKIKVGIVAKYSRLSDSYLSVLESIKLSGFNLGIEVAPVFVDSEDLEKFESREGQTMKKLKQVDALIVPGGFGRRGMEGKILAIKYARENKIPFLGICLGLQMAVVEFGRNICGLNAVSSEMYEDRSMIKDKDVLIDFMAEQLNIYHKGGTMRLGGYDCKIAKNTLAHKVFEAENIRERHRHRLEVQPKYIKTLEKNGMIISGRHFYKNNSGQTKDLVEIVELPTDTHPYFIAIQSHPELLSRLGKPHPLFKNLLQIANTLKL